MTQSTRCNFSLFSSTLASFRTFTCAFKAIFVAFIPSLTIEAKVGPQKYAATICTLFMRFIAIGIAPFCSVHSIVHLFRHKFQIIYFVIKRISVLVVHNFNRQQSPTKVHFHIVPMHRRKPALFKRHCQIALGRKRTSSIGPTFRFPSWASVFLPPSPMFRAPGSCMAFFSAARNATYFHSMVLTWVI